jgi:predicted MFS family arabinose efflux permease
MIPGAIAIVSNIIAAYAVQKFKRKSPIMLIIMAFPIAGAAALYALPRTAENQKSLLAVYFIFQIYQPITPIIMSWTFANTAGHTKKTSTTGALYVGLCVGNIVGPQLYFDSEKPYYRTVSFNKAKADIRVLPQILLSFVS